MGHSRIQNCVKHYNEWDEYALFLSSGAKAILKLTLMLKLHALCEGGKVWTPVLLGGLPALYTVYIDSPSCLANNRKSPLCNPTENLKIC